MCLIKTILYWNHKFLNRYASKSVWVLAVLFFVNCAKQQHLEVTSYETSADGKKLELQQAIPQKETDISITLFPEQTFQTITGFGGSFTEASASLLNKLSSCLLYTSPSPRDS